MALRLKLLAFTCRDFISGRNEQYVTDLPLIQPFGFQNEVECLVPRHVLQTKGDVATDGIAGNQVQVSKISDQLEYGTNINILEVQRQLFTGIGKTVCLALIGLFFCKRLYADGQLVVCLVGEIIVSPSRLDGDTGTACLSGRVDKLHRRSEILDVEPNTQCFRQLRLGEHNADLSSLLFDSRTYRRIGQCDYHVSGTIFTAAKIDIVDRLAGRHRLYRSRLGNRSSDRGGCSRRAGRPRALSQHDKQIVPIHSSGIRNKRGQIDDEPGAPLSLDDRYAARITNA